MKNQGIDAKHVMGNNYSVANTKSPLKNLLSTKKGRTHCAGQLQNVKHLSNGPIKDVKSVFIEPAGRQKAIDDDAVVIRK